MRGIHKKGRSNPNISSKVLLDEKLLRNLTGHWRIAAKKISVIFKPKGCYTYIVRLRNVMQTAMLPG
jgi:hypothetical protein